MDIQNKISSLRQRQDMTQEELALKLDVSRQTINVMEKGGYTPSLLLAFKISKLFKLPIEKIFFLK